MKKPKLDKDEKEILESFEGGEWESVPNLKEEVARHQDYARNTLRKDRRVNIRISSKDLEAIQTAAVEQGLPYQTMMASILHRYISGSLVDRESRLKIST